MQKKIQYPFNFHSQNTHTHIPSWFKKQWLRTGIKFDLSELDKGLLQNQTKKKNVIPYLMINDTIYYSDFRMQAFCPQHSYSLLY